MVTFENALVTSCDVETMSRREACTMLCMCMVVGSHMYFPFVLTMFYQCQETWNDKTVDFNYDAEGAVMKCNGVDIKHVY